MDSTTTPHADIELAVDRSVLGYSSCVPDAGVNRDTGLVLFIAGYGMDTRGAYTQSLLFYLANKHNCVAASVEYFGAKIMSGADGQIVPHPNLLNKLAEHYGLSLTMWNELEFGQLLWGLTKVLLWNGISDLNPECTVIRTANEYNSMGFLPALDGLQIVHVLTTTLPLNRTRIFLLGTFHGGYIAGMMAKLAPHTFRMVLDNSGFSSAEDDLDGVLGWTKFVIKGVGSWRKPQYTGRPIRTPPTSFQKSDERSAICLAAIIILGNSARIYAYHAATDVIAPIA
jgi:hypothetical protein